MSSFDYGSRLERARRLMTERDIDVLLLSVGADLPYFTGYQATPLERLTMLVLAREGDATLVVPRLEAPRVAPQPEIFELRAWEETEDPVALVAKLAEGARRAAVGNQLWAVFLLELQRLMPSTRFQPAASLTSRLRMRKEPAELDCLRRAAGAADRVVERLARHRFGGKSEQRVAREIGEMVVEEGHESAGLAIVAAGPNGASPHHEPGERHIEAGDAVVVDFGGTVHGYFSDTTRNFVLREAGPNYRAAFEALEAAQEAAVQAVRPGVTAASVDRAARAVIEDAGYGEHFVHRTGHGIGLEVHEHPYIVEGNDLVLQPDMTFSVEPGIYLPGRFGMRIEDIVAVTEQGVERLNDSPRSPFVVS
jgi:Xaa-Pro aminopeptidase